MTTSLYLDHYKSYDLPEVTIKVARPTDDYFTIRFQVNGSAYAPSEDKDGKRKQKWLYVNEEVMVSLSPEQLSDLQRAIHAATKVEDKGDWIWSL